MVFCVFTDCGGSGTDDLFQLERQPGRSCGLADGFGRGCGTFRCPPWTAGLFPDERRAAVLECPLHHLGRPFAVQRRQRDRRHRRHRCRNSAVQRWQIDSAVDLRLDFQLFFTGRGRLWRTDCRGGPAVSRAGLFAGGFRGGSGHRSQLVGHLRVHGGFVSGHDVRHRSQRRLSGFLGRYPSGGGRLSLRNLRDPRLWRLENDQAQCRGALRDRHGHGRRPVFSGRVGHVDPGRTRCQPGRINRLSGRGAPENVQPNRAVGCQKRYGVGWALSAYLILIVIVFMGVVYAPLREFLGQVKLSLAFPEITSHTGWVVAAGKGKAINIFGHGGALLGYASIISYLVYAAKGYYTRGALKRIVSNSVKSGVPTSLGIVSMVCFAMIMDHCGMIYLLAEGISRLFGGLYPFFSTWIGLLGAFMTGSNTNSNVVFGVLQQQTAELAGLSAAIILAAQTTGGALGSMIAPAKILVGCSTVGLSGKEAPVLRATLRYGLLITALMGLLTLLVEIIV